MSAQENPGKPRIVEKKNGEIIDSVAMKIEGKRVIIAFHHAPWDAADVWVVNLVVGATRKGKKGARQRADLPHLRRTKAGLVAALRWASSELDKFQRERPGAILVVHPITPTGDFSFDSARGRAYAWLLRKGFQRGQYAGASVYFRAS